MFILAIDTALEYCAAAVLDTDTQDVIAQFNRLAVKAGTFVIWKGPITDSAGKEILKAGDAADDKFLHGINFYVKGVQGKLPS